MKKITTALAPLRRQPAQQCADAITWTTSKSPVLKSFLLAFLAVSVATGCSDADTDTEHSDNRCAAYGGGFETAVSYGVGGWLQGITAGDVNGDNVADLVMSDPVSNNIDVMLNNGDGTFATPVAYPVPGASWLTLMELNDDGQLDIVALTGALSDVSVLYNLGGGEFGNGKTYSSGSSEGFIASTGAAADFNGDGQTDVVGVSINLQLVLNQDGAFNSRKVFQASNAEWGRKMTAADFDQDGAVDVAVTDSSSELCIVRNQGDGTFEPPNCKTLAYVSMGSVVAADLNGDGWPDIAAGAEGASSISPVAVFMNAGDGTFPNKTEYPAGSGMASVAAADMNADGHQDLIIANFSSNDVSLLLNNGDGTFTPMLDSPVAATPHWITAADFNGDGMLDVAVTAAGSVSVLMSKCATEVTPRAP